MEYDPLITTLFVATRAIHFGACLLLFGLFAFDLFIANPVIRRHQTIAAAWARIVRFLTVFAIVATLASGAAWLVLGAITMTGYSPAEALHAAVLRTLLTETHFGKLWEIRSLLWLTTTLFAIIAMFWPRTKGLALISSGMLAASLAWAGHGLTGEPATLHLVADSLHILIGGLWPIGLLPLFLLLLRLRQETTLSKWTMISSLVRRFSMTSLASVALLILTGIINSWVLVGSVSNLFSTFYGKVLLAKIAVFGAMVLLGAVNMLHLKPRLSLDLTEGIAAEGEAAARRLRRNVALEVALATGVFVLVGLLGMLAPAMHEYHHH